MGEPANGLGVGRRVVHRGIGSDGWRFVASTVVSLIRCHKVPAVHAVSAPVGNGVAWLELCLRVREEMTGPPTVDTDDGLGCPHGLNLACRRIGPAGMGPAAMGSGSAGLT